MTISRLLICDRHQLFRQGLARQLAAVSAVRLVATAATGAEALRLAKAHTLDVILLDLGVGSPDALEVMHTLNARSAAPAVIVLSEHADLPHLLTAHYAGAAAYVPKDADSTCLLDTITQVAATQNRLSLEQVLELHQRYGRRVKNLPEVPSLHLTERHTYLLALLIKGYSNREIAGHLGVREKTVRNELSRLYRKLGVRSRTEAALFAVKTGLLMQEPH